MKEIGIIASDLRETFIAEELFELGHRVKVLSSKKDFSPALITYSNLEEIIKVSDYIIAPMSGTDENGKISSDFFENDLIIDDKFCKIAKNEKFIIGYLRDKQKNILNANKIKYYELIKSNELAILNAIPTAEGAIKVAIENTVHTLYKSEVLILGLGRVGMRLAWRLKVLGAKVYAVTRNKTSISKGLDIGINMINYSNLDNYLSEFDILFNTVPARIITNTYINFLKETAVIIDLASSPGGTDFESAKKRNIKAILASGLPGKVAPKTSGILIAKYINDNILI